MVRKKKVVHQSPWESLHVTGQSQQPGEVNFIRCRILKSKIPFCSLWSSLLYESKVNCSSVTSLSFFLGSLLPTHHHISLVDKGNRHLFLYCQLHEMYIRLKRKGKEMNFWLWWTCFLNKKNYNEDRNNIVGGAM